MNSLDITILVLCFLAALRGYFKGFVMELCTAIGLIAGLIACLEFGPLASKWLLSFTHNEQLMGFTGYLLTFVIVFLLVMWAGKLVEGGLKLAQLGTLNRLGGAFISVFKVCFVMSLLLWVADHTGILTVSAMQHSRSYQLLDGMAITVLRGLGELVPAIGQVLKDSEHFFNSLGSAHTV